MNIENIDKTIAIMERSKERDSVDMRDWQTPVNGHSYVNTEEEFHACGNKACLAGHIALSPEWKESGGKLCESGAPVHSDFLYPPRAISEWWGVSVAVVRSFIHAASNIYPTRNIYPVSWNNVKADHVIEKLQELKTLCEEEFVKKYGISI